MDKLKKNIKEFPEIWVPAIYVASVLIVSILLGVFVLSPSHEQRREKCAAQGGVVISGGACVKKESVVGY